MGSGHPQRRWIRRYGHAAGRKATVNLDAALYRRVKIKAAEDGVTITSIFERALARYLDGQGHGQSRPEVKRHFEVPTLSGTGGLLPGIDLTDDA